jgi:hypothetical protein
MYVWCVGAVTFAPILLSNKWNIFSPNYVQWLMITRTLPQNFLDDEIVQADG